MICYTRINVKFLIILTFFLYECSNYQMSCDIVEKKHNVWLLLFSFIQEKDMQLQS